MSPWFVISPCTVVAVYLYCCCCCCWSRFPKSFHWFLLRRALVVERTKCRLLPMSATVIIIIMLLLLYRLDVLVFDEHVAVHASPFCHPPLPWIPVLTCLSCSSFWSCADIASYHIPYVCQFASSGRTTARRLDLYVLVEIGCCFTIKHRLQVLTQTRMQKQPALLPIQSNPIHCSIGLFANE